MKRFLPLLLLMTMTACAGAKLEKQQKEIEELQTKAGSLYSQLKESAGEAEALKAANAELQGKLVEANGRAAAAEGRADTLKKSNMSLSDAIGASKDELGQKLREVVAEKDELAKSLSETVKAKLSVERLKTIYQSARDKTAKEVARLKDERDALLRKTAEVEGALLRSGTEDKKAEEARAAALLRAREDMGSAADAVLKEMQAGRASVEQSGETFMITLDDGELFEEGSAKVSENGAAVLGRVGAALKAMPSKTIRVEAHSDNSPFKKGLLGKYAGHWELTAARATAMARWLHEHAGLDPARIAAAGYGEFRPAKPNDTPEGRAANRRAVIVVAPSSQ